MTDMMKLLLAAAFLAVASCVSISLEDLEFHAWKLKFGKSYSSPSEESDRKTIWLNNRRLVLVHNIMADQGMKSYRLGMTFFADLENKEYKQLVSRGYLLHFNASAPRGGSTFLPLPIRADIPSTVDWRNKGYVTNVKDQKACNAGWAFSTTGSLEGQTFRKTGKLVSLSEQQLVDCSGDFGNEGCVRGLMVNAFRSIRDNGGIDTEESYTYEAQGKLCRYNPDNIGATCSGYVNVKTGDERALQQAVATVGPVSVVIDASHESFQLYESGLYDEPGCRTSDIHHGVLVVGYGTDNERDYWLVKNSWGRQWGDKGYIMMSRNKSNQCGIATAASYPLV